MNGAHALQGSKTNVENMNLVLCDVLEDRIISQLKDMHEPMLEANNVFQINRTCKLEQIDLDKDQAIDESGCEDSEDEWDFIDINKSKTSQSSEKSRNQDQDNLLPNKSINFVDKILVDKNMSSELEAASGCGISDISASSEGQLTKSIESPNKFLQNCTDNNFIDESDISKIFERSLVNDKNLIDSTLDTIVQDSSLLDPTAKEFVPTFGQLTTTISTQNNASNLFLNDDIVAQSPRKSSAMENLNVPSELEFDREISSRPHELEAPNGLMILTETVESLNAKEAACGDEKTEEGYLIAGESIKVDSKNNHFILLEQFEVTKTIQQSIYTDEESEELNKVQVLPESEEFSKSNKASTKCDSFSEGAIESVYSGDNNLLDVAHQLSTKVTSLLKQAELTVADAWLKKDLMEQNFTMEGNHLKQIEKEENELKDSLAQNHLMNSSEDLVLSSHSETTNLNACSKHFQIAAEIAPRTMTIPVEPAKNIQTIIVDKNDPHTGSLSNEMSTFDSPFSNETLLISEKSPVEQLKPLLIEPIPDVIPKAVAANSKNNTQPSLANSKPINKSPKSSKLTKTKFSTVAKCTVSHSVESKKSTIATAKRFLGVEVHPSTVASTNRKPVLDRNLKTSIAPRSTTLSRPNTDTAKLTPRTTSSPKTIASNGASIKFKADTKLKTSTSLSSATSLLTSCKPSTQTSNIVSSLKSSEGAPINTALASSRNVVKIRKLPIQTATSAARAAAAAKKSTEMANKANSAPKSATKAAVTLKTTASKASDNKKNIH